MKLLLILSILTIFISCTPEVSEEQLYTGDACINSCWCKAQDNASWNRFLEECSVEFYDLKESLKFPEDFQEEIQFCTIFASNGSYIEKNCLKEYPYLFVEQGNASIIPNKTRHLYCPGEKIFKDEQENLVRCDCSYACTN